MAKRGRPRTNPAHAVTDERLIELASSERSISRILRCLGLATGNSFAIVRRRLQELGAYHEKFKVAKQHKGMKFVSQEDLRRRAPTILDSSVRPKRAKRYMMAMLDPEERGRCSCCRLSEWMGKPIVLEMDHVNGDRTDNRFDNLRLLCPNCHSQTPTWKGRNISKGRSVSDDELLTAFVEEKSVEGALRRLGYRNTKNAGRICRLIAERFLA